MIGKVLSAISLAGILFQSAISAPILYGDGQGISADGSFGATGGIYDYRVYGVSSRGTASFDVIFSNTPTNDALLIRYSLIATEDMQHLSFYTYLDAEIDEAHNTYWNEAGEAFVADGGADFWEIDEPGYYSGDLLDNFKSGEFDNRSFNGALSTVDDVAFGLGFDIGALYAGQRVDIDMIISEVQLSGTQWGTVLHQWDDDLGENGDQLYFAGRYAISAITVPEPGVSMMLFAGIAIFLLCINRMYIKPKR